MQQEAPPVETHDDNAAPRPHDTQPVRVRHRRHSRTRLGKLRRRLLRRRTLINALIGLVVVAVVLVLGQAVLVIDSVNQLNSSYDNLNRVLSTVSARPGSDLTLTDFTRLQSSVNDVSRTIDTARSRVRLIRPLAAANPEWEAQLAQLDIARELTTATQDMLNGLQPTLFFMVGGSEEDTVVTQISAGARIVELLEVGRGQFLRADEHLSTARALIDRVPLATAAPETLLQIDSMNAFYERIKNVNDLLLEAPNLLTFALGLDSQRSYLVLATNSDELRPSGGYLSTYGWLLVRNGRVADYDYSPTTTTTPAPPSESAQVDFTVPSWWIQYRSPIYAAWDGSWYADYPATADMAMWYYNAGNNIQSPVSGAINIDIIGFEYILRAIGEVIVPGYDRPINAGNFREVVYNIRAFGEGEAAHKRFIAEVYKTIFAEWQSASGDINKNNALLGALLQALQERHIMLHFSDPQLNAAIDLLGWSGKMQVGGDHDYLMVADANLGNKSNSSIIRQLTYDVTVQADNTLSSAVSISYEYPASIAANDPAVDPEFHGPLDYKNLLQVFVPLNSTLIETSGLTTDPIIDGTERYTNFIGRVALAYDSAERFQFRYNTPALVESVGAFKRYRLLLQKQPGMRAERANVQLSLPPGTRVVSASPTPAQTYQLDNLILDFRLDLTTDQWIEVTFE